MPAAPALHLYLQPTVEWEPVHVGYTTLSGAVKVPLETLWELVVLVRAERIVNEPVSGACLAHDAHLGVLTTHLRDT